MPHTYWPTDNKLEVSKSKHRKRDFGINEKDFVFASFNQTYKIEKEMYDRWLNILRKTDDSVLLIYSKESRTKDNLTKYAVSKKISPSRIVFAKELPKEKHLARIRDIVDLSLDTKIVNGHTTTTDSLWAGVPVITVLGEHFASRVSGSMLGAIGLPELLTKSLDEYEKLAVSLAKDTDRLKALKTKLKRNIKTKPLFDTPKYTRGLEKAYRIMYKRFLEGKTPINIKNI
jgi:protein O-GlcNAc transferase